MKRLAFLCLFLVGCISAGDRKLNEQNYHAGKFVAENSSGEVKQAGIDIAANSTVIAQGIGAPDVPAGKYTPELSADARKQATQEHEADGWFTTLLKGAAGNLPWGGTVLALFTTVVGLYRKLSLKKAQFVSVVEGIDKVKDTLMKSTDTSKIPTVIDDILRQTASAHNLYVQIRDDIKKIRGSK
jgi:hypothetical protein